MKKNDILWFFWKEIYLKMLYSWW